MEHGFLSQKWSGGRRGVKGKNKDVAAKDGVSPSVTVRKVVLEKQSSLVDTSVPTVENMELCLYPPLPTQGSTSAGNALGKSSYANVTGKSSGRKLNFHTLFTLGGNGIDVVVLGRSSYARAMIELRADVELKDNIVAPMPKTTREGYYTCNICVEYGWKPPRCVCCKVFVHVLEECPKNIGASATKNLKKTSQTPKGILVGPKMGFKAKQVFQPVSKKSTANSGVQRRIIQSLLKWYEWRDLKLGVSSSTPIGEKINKIERQICEGKLMLSPSGKDGSDKGYGTNSLLEQWKDSYPDNDDYDPYDDDMYESHDMSEHLQSICDDFDITVRGRKKK
ncbi:hypothetical protein Tco_1388786 [Tanacetum coccineum]